MTFRDGVGRYLNRDEDPVKWSNAWDRYLERKFRPLPSYPGILSLRPAEAAKVLGQSFLSVLEAMHRDLCTLQDDLAEFTAEKRAEDNFESKWLEMSSQEREQHLLQGLVITCGSVSDMEERRENCPETTISNLQQDGGKGFLALLATLCPPSARRQPRPEPIFVSHPVVDAILGVGQPCPPNQNEAAISTMQRFLLTTRNFFLAFLVWNTMLHIYGESQNYGSSKHGGEKRDIRSTGALFDGTPEELAALQVQKETREALRDAQYHCNNCKKPQSALPPGKTFQMCAGCRKIGRKTPYCDEKCQVNDWKKSSPPHKTVCGKQHAIRDPVHTTPVQPAVVPSTSATNSATAASDPETGSAPGFKHSKALLHQIALLEENPSLDYVLVEPDPKPDHGFTLAHPMGKMLFQVSKNRAMKNGDPKAVAMLYKQLVDSARKDNFSPARLLLQLSAEYGIAVGTLSKLVEEKEETEETRQGKAKIDRMAADFDRKFRAGGAHIDEAVEA